MLTQNSSNLMHILMSLYHCDLAHAPALCKVLVTRGVNPDLPNADQKTPLFMAIKKQQLHAISNFPGDFNARGSQGRTPLHYCVLKGCLNGFKIVLQKADVLLRDEKLQTARQVALINSAHFRLLVRQERQQVRAQVGVCS